MRRILVLLCLVFVILAVTFKSKKTVVFAQQDSKPRTSATTAGALQMFDREGNFKQECPLKHTDVSVEISGFIARVKVIQSFENTTTENLEALYTFPLSQNAAVNDMT